MTKHNDHNQKEGQTENSAQPEASGTPAARAAAIRALNDRLRRTARGGIVMITDGIAALDANVIERVLKAVADFDDFNPDNDPWGEHDCAVLTVDGLKVIFKIDYYDRTRTYGSSDPADPKLTTRVLTIMRAEEY